MKITICRNCCGHGRVGYDIGTHKSEYEVKTCPECKGSGRLNETMVTELEPFMPGQSAERKF